MVRGRSADVEAEQTQEVFEVHLLVSRHGLSCTNVMATYIGPHAIGRKNFLDPPLAGAGRSASVEAGMAVSKWMATHEVDRLDAVMSSVLIRAQITAALTFPHHPEPIHVVPHIRELASGKSNRPDTPAAQARVLKADKDVGAKVQVDHRWAQTFDPMSPGDWENFEKFLERNFLPTLLAGSRMQTRIAEARKRGHRNPAIFIGVVTHSNLMRDSSLGKRCSGFWRGEASKPLNNQVLHVTYNLNVRTPAPSDMDRTTRYRLWAGNGCSQVHHGQSTKANGAKILPICARDIGETCYGPIHEYIFVPAASTWLDESLVEPQILPVAQRFLKLKEVEHKFTIARQLTKAGQESYDRIRADVTRWSERLTDMMESRCLATGLKPDPTWYLQQNEAARNGSSPRLLTFFGVHGRPPD